MATTKKKKKPETAKKKPTHHRAAVKKSLTMAEHKKAKPKAPKATAPLHDHKKFETDMERWIKLENQIILEKEEIATIRKKYLKRKKKRS